MAPRLGQARGHVAYLRYVMCHCGIQSIILISKSLACKIQPRKRIAPAFCRRGWHLLDSIADVAVTESIRTVIALGGTAIGAKLAARIRSKARANKAALQGALSRHRKDVSKWCKSVDIMGMPSPKQIKDIYIELRLTDDPRRFRMGSPDEHVTTLGRIIEARSNLVILGDLGSGKTTSLKMVAYDLLEKDRRIKKGRTPVVIRLRELRKGTTFLECLRRLLSIDFGSGNSETEEHEQYDTIENRILVGILDRICSFLLLDGLDEMDTTVAKTFIDELDFLCKRLELTRVILTSRSGEFIRKPDGFLVYELHHLADDQVGTFVRLWFESVPERRRSPEEFIEALESAPYKDLAKRPLTLANLCLVFEKYGALPETPISIYRKILNLLLEEWDAERGIHRKSKYAYFDPHRKTDFLSAFAYRLLMDTGSALSFSSTNLRSIYAKICKRFALPIDDADAVVSEIESHTGIIARSSYGSYEFTHKSIQEYLVAEYISRLRDVPEAIPLLRKCPNELAIAVVLSSDPTDWFCSIFRDKSARIKPRSEILIPFLLRISLEKPSFDPSPELGSTCLWLVARTLGVEIVKRDIEKERMREHSVRTFLDIPSIQDAIRAFLAYCEVSDGVTLGTTRILCRRPVESRYPLVTEVEIPSKYLGVLLRPQEHD